MTLKENLLHWILKGAIEEDGKRRRLVVLEIRRRLDKFFKGGNMEENKKWFHSKTIWFNIVSGIVTIAASLQSDGGLSPQLASIMASVVTIGNVVLRFITEKPIK